ncbi:hypothetical protein [Halomonas huangheensis]|uniref:Uncharacterized protein n=1 Tax=Halomonas huangheensis TaxID=1178482 RepID=W1N3H7_9GAMM|nr:hypothetical protein [Halomonas huangheensis]ALM51635.1 hypothetical protein AR456_04535 [Halomonas huangheensis]ERL50117.1 hypothetical protein BJB45_03050 [Halomonas huangheensis]
MLGQRKQQVRQYSRVWWVLALSLGTPAAMAATTDFSPLEEAAESRQLNDEELGQLRGRFVDKGRVMFFGVEMVSHWRTASGDHLTAGTRMIGDLMQGQPSVRFQPVINSFSTDEVARLSTGGSGATVVDRGTRNASGVVQSIQAGGNFNIANNGLSLDVMDASDFRSGAQGGVKGGRVEAQGANNSRMSISMQPRDMSVAIDLPGHGRIEQAIVPGSGLRQSIQLTSNLQRVQNLTRLQLYMGNQPGGSHSEMPGVLNGIRAAAALR